jgi:hypothetical protein
MSDPVACFVVRGEVAKDALSTIKKGDTVWLGWTHEGGGWFQWGHRCEPGVRTPLQLRGGGLQGCPSL